MSEYDPLLQEMVETLPLPNLSQVTALEFLEHMSDTLLRDDGATFLFFTDSFGICRMLEISLIRIEDGARPMTDGRVIMGPRDHQ